MKIFLFFLISFSFNILSEAQSDCSCCSTEYKQFDFWVGDWIVLDTTGKKLGENNISKKEDNCLLAEEWKGASGSTGSSYNYYNPSDLTWNQLWVDNNGGILQLKGNFSSGKMILKSDLLQGKKGMYYNQITWSPHPDGTVSQVWQIFDKNDHLLNTLFMGIYHKK